MRAGNPVNRMAVISSFQVSVMSHLGESDQILMFTLTRWKKYIPWHPTNELADNQELESEFKCYSTVVP